MLSKFKSILETRWKEPRHFFFCLAMFSVWVFAGLLFVCLDALVRPTPMIILAGLGCILCFVTSLGAFILAWIPPARRLFSWLLGRPVFTLGSMITLVALFYAVENWRGRRAWQHFKREGESRGERFDLSALIPPPVPNDQNFFETPLWEDLHFVQTNNITRFDVFGPKPSDSPYLVTMAKAQRVDLAAWQGFYRGSNNLFSAQGGPPTNYFPIAKEPREPAADVLLALSKYEPNRQLLIAASARPHARFWINYDAGSAMLLPHLPQLKTMAQFLSLHSVAALKARDRAAAFEDVKVWLRSIESIRSEPILISHLVRIAMLHIGLQPVWEGLTDRQWTDAELKFIEGELGKIDFLGDYHFAMGGERALSLWTIDYMRKAGGRGAAEWAANLVSWDPGPIFQEIQNAPGLRDIPNWNEALTAAVLSLIPAGWFDQNKLSLCRAYAAWLLPLVDREQRVVRPAVSKELVSGMEKRGWRLYDVFSARTVRVLQNEAEKHVRAQSYVDLARLACALERYRQANGHFPETLAPLVPGFIEKLPHDVINGQPLKYRRADEGGFVLYSVGWNETDDEGKVGLRKSGYVAWSEGDWVWRCPAKYH